MNCGALRAEALKMEGNGAHQAKEYEKAIKLYSQAIELDPANPIYYNNRAAAKIELKDYKSAMLDCQEALSIDPKFAKAFARIGNCFLRLGNFFEARRNFAEALHIEPTNLSLQQNVSIPFPPKKTHNSLLCNNLLCTFLIARFFNSRRKSH